MSPGRFFLWRYLDGRLRCNATDRGVLDVLRERRCFVQEAMVLEASPEHIYLGSKLLLVRPFGSAVFFSAKRF